MRGGKTEFNMFYEDLKEVGKKKTTVFLRCLIEKPNVVSISVHFI